MKKIYYKDIILVLIIIILGIYIALNIFNDDKISFISDSDYLYDKAINYLIDNDNNSDKDKDNYKMFTDYKGFGIAQDHDYKYVYMWVLTSSYYTKENKLVESSGQSMFYKFTFNKNDKFIKYDTPEEGRMYEVSIKNMVPRSIYKKIFNYTLDDSKLKEEVASYYKDILD